jgi:signal peptidase I
MNPTLQQGDYLWVSTLSYGLSKETYPFDLGLGNTRFFASMPRRGDVAIFKLPSFDNMIYIKRVIGLPSDKIQMKQGRLFINGTMVARQRVADLTVRDLYGHEGPLPTYEETLPEGLTYNVLEVEGDTGFYDNTNVYDVPSGHYFVLGDNRDNSTDSRVEITQHGVGMVPYENFIARVDRVYFSTERSDRFFQPVH